MLKNQFLTFAISLFVFLVGAINSEAAEIGCFERLVQSAPAPVQEALTNTLMRIPILKKELEAAKRDLDKYRSVLDRTPSPSIFSGSAARLARSSAVWDTDLAMQKVRDYEANLKSQEQNLKTLIQQVYQLDPEFAAEFEKLKIAESIQEDMSDYLTALTQYKKSLNWRLFWEGLDTISVSGALSSLHYFFYHKQFLNELKKSNEKYNNNIKSGSAEALGLSTEVRETVSSNWSMAATGIEAVDAFGDIFVKLPIRQEINSQIGETIGTSFSGIILDHLSLLNVVLSLRNYKSTVDSLKRTKEQKLVLKKKISELKKETIDMVCQTELYCTSHMYKAVDSE